MPRTDRQPQCNTKVSSVTSATLCGTEPCRRAVAMKCFTQEKWDQLLANIRSKCQGQLPLGDEPQAFLVAPDCARAESAGNPIHHACEYNRQHVIMWPNPHNMHHACEYNRQHYRKCPSRCSLESLNRISSLVIDHGGCGPSPITRPRSEHIKTFLQLYDSPVSITLHSGPVRHPTQRAVRHGCPPTTPCTALHRAFHSPGTLL